MARKSQKNQWASKSPEERLQALSELFEDEARYLRRHLIILKRKHQRELERDIDDYIVRIVGAINVVTGRTPDQRRNQRSDQKLAEQSKK